MQISSWLNMFRRSIAGQLDAFGQRLAAQTAMLQQLQQGQAKIMATMDELKAAEQAQGDKIEALITLTNEIFDKLGQSSASNDPAVQEVMDLIAKHNADMDAAMTRDVAAVPASGSAPADGSGAPPAADPVPGDSASSV